MSTDLAEIIEAPGTLRKHVRPFGGGEVVALPPSAETSEGRRWTF